jgi:hypothetical protein
MKITKLYIHRSIPPKGGYLDLLSPFFFVLPGLEVAALLLTQSQSQGVSLPSTS